MNDRLTGLLTRETLSSLLNGLSSESPSASEHSVLIVDVDHLKRCNDIFGLPEGDRVLKELASLITRELPTPNYLGRIGGDEFLAILPSTGLTAAVGVAERLRSSVERASE